MAASSKNDVYCSVLKQDIIKCDVAIKGFLQVAINSISLA